MKLYKKIILIIPLFIVAVLISYIKPKAYTTETLPSGYRLLSVDDVGKTFGVDLELDIIAIEVQNIYEQDGEGNNIKADITILSTFGVSEVINFQYLADPYSGAFVKIKKNDNIIYHNSTINNITEDVIITMTSGETIATVGEYENYNNYKIFYVKDIIIPTITFETNGATAIDPVEAGVLPELPIPLKSGYLFLGWYYEIDFQSEATEGDLITADVTLYAKWEYIPVITYETNGAASIDPVEADTLPELPIPLKNGYLFLGWYYEIDFQTEAFEGDLIDDDVTLYAKWEKLPFFNAVIDHTKNIVDLALNTFNNISNAVVNNNLLIIALTIPLLAVAFGVLVKIVKTFKKLE